MSVKMEFEVSSLRNKILKLESELDSLQINNAKLESALREEKQKAAVSSYESSRMLEIHEKSQAWLKNDMARLESTNNLLKDELSAFKAREQRIHDLHKEDHDRIEALGKELRSKEEQLTVAEVTKRKALDEADMWKAKFLELKEKHTVPIVDLADDGDDEDLPPLETTAAERGQRGSKRRCAEAETTLPPTEVFLVGSSSRMPLPPRMKKTRKSVHFPIQHSHGRTRSGHVPARSGNVPVRGEVISAERKAEEFKSYLDPRYPSLIKVMSRSNVTGSSSMYLSRDFCNKHLCTWSQKLVLEDDRGFISEVSYKNCGLGIEWKGFAKDHNLEAGDAVIFHLAARVISSSTAPPKFKVYIFKA